MELADADRIDGNSGEASPKRPILLDTRSDRSVLSSPLCRFDFESSSSMSCTYISVHVGRLSVNSVKSPRHISFIQARSALPWPWRYFYFAIGHEWVISIMRIPIH